MGGKWGRKGNRSVGWSSVGWRQVLNRLGWVLTEWLQAEVLCR